MFGVSYEFLDFVFACTRVKYGSMSSLQDYETILESPYFDKISKSMKIPTYSLLGFVHLIFGNITSKEAYSCLKMILASYRVNNKLFI